MVQEKNIISCDDSNVTFRYTDSSGQVRTRTVDGADFLWLLLLHVLPRGFRLTRTYGLLHANCMHLVWLLQLLFRCRSTTPRTTAKPRLILPLDHPLATTPRAAYSLPFASICFQ